MKFTDRLEKALQEGINGKPAQENIYCARCQMSTPHSINPLACTRCGTPKQASVQKIPNRLERPINNDSNYSAL